MQSFLKPLQNLPQILRQSLAALLFQFLRDTVEPLSNGTGDCRQRVAVATEGNGSADHILKAVAFQKGGDGFRDGFLTAFHMVVGGADFVAGTAQIVMEIGFDVGLDFRFRAAGTGKIDGTGVGFRALDALGVIVGNFRRQPGHVPDGFQIVKQPSGRGHPHGRAVAVAAVGLGVGVFQPPAEHSAVNAFSTTRPPETEKSVSSVISLP